jgi:hypothetical protein
MNAPGRDTPLPDPNFERNRQQYPQEELLKLVGQHVVWSWDGTRILDADPDLTTLDRRLIAAGIDLGRVIHDFVEDPNEGWL